MGACTSCAGAVKEPVDPVTGKDAAAKHDDDDAAVLSKDDVLLVHASPQPDINVGKEPSPDGKLTGEASGSMSAITDSVNEDMDHAPPVKDDAIDVVVNEAAPPDLPAAEPASEPSPAPTSLAAERPVQNRSVQDQFGVSVPAIVAKIEQQVAHLASSPRSSPRASFPRSLSSHVVPPPPASTPVSTELDTPSAVAQSPAAVADASPPPTAEDSDPETAPEPRTAAHPYAVTDEAAASAAPYSEPTASAVPVLQLLPSPSKSPAKAAKSPSKVKSPVKTNSPAASFTKGAATSSAVPPARRSVSKASTVAATAVAGNTGPTIVFVPRPRVPFAAAAPTLSSISRQRSPVQALQAEQTKRMRTAPMPYTATFNYGQDGSSTPRTSVLSSFLPDAPKPMVEAGGSKGSADGDDASVVDGAKRPAGSKKSAKKKYKKTSHGKKLVKK